MFEVQPVRSPDFQKELARTLGTEYIANTVAFFAGEMNDDFTSVKYVIALCQFSFTPEKAIIHSLAIREGSEQDEAVTILIRTVMNWAYRADIPLIEFEEEAASDEYKKSVSFRKNGEGKWTVDLQKFYRSPCHYNQENK